MTEKTKNFAPLDDDNHLIPRAAQRMLASSAVAALCREAGADDAGFVEFEREALADQRASVSDAIPWARSFVVLVYRLNRHNIRVPLRSVSSTEFVEGVRDIKSIVRKVVRGLEAEGVRAASISGFFPMELGRLPNLPWIASLKDLAKAAGIGVMGRNRLILHPEFGADIFLGAVVTDASFDQVGRPLKKSPCVECNLCVATCPTGAISADDRFDFTSCVTHNYREKLGGFVEWVHTLADSRNRHDYRRRVSDAETLSWWQSLGYESNTHCDYCMAVCPAGAESRAFLADRKRHYRDVVAPLRDRAEQVFVVPGSDAEAHAIKKFPHKPVRRIGNGMVAPSIPALIGLLPHLFQSGRSEGLAARYHFRFRGKEPAEVTIEIRDRKIAVEKGLTGKPDLVVTADSSSWLGFLAKERHIAWELLRGRIRLKGSPRLLLAFGRCFPL